MDRQAIMSRAWVIFRQTYNYPSNSFRCIGRQCFAWALKEAWRLAREAARIAAFPDDLKVARRAELERDRSLLAYCDSYSVAQFRTREIEQELTHLAA